MTEKNLNFLEIPPNTLNSYSEYEISLTYTNFMNKVGNDQIPIKTTSHSGIIIELENQEP